MPRVPSLTNPDLVIRLAETNDEIEQANQLIYRNYVGLYWPDDIGMFRRNKYLTSPERHVFVATDGDGVIGTMSIITDSSLGLPSDSFQPEILKIYRQQNERMAELTSFAVDQSIKQPTSLILFLYKFFLQYSFYYLNLDRLIGSCRPKHADFYQKVLCFEKLTVPLPYGYAGGVECQLVTLDLTRVHELLSTRYSTAPSFYRFLLVDEHPNVHLPDKTEMPRARAREAVVLQYDKLRIAV